MCDGSGRPLTTVGIETDREPSEHLLVVSRDRQIVARREGGVQNVSVDSELDRRLLMAGSDLTLIHNHPVGVGLSPDDLSHLAKPGVLAMVAIGHDGSVYIAAAGRHLSAGVVDVKSYHIESADEVAERIERLLAAGVPEAGLSLVPDCGFSQTARWATKPKLRALVEGRDLVRGRRPA